VCGFGAAIRQSGRGQRRLLSSEGRMISLRGSAAMVWTKPLTRSAMVRIIDYCFAARKRRTR
jgi:hypothetical protein